MWLPIRVTPPPVVEEAYVTLGRGTLRFGLSAGRLFEKMCEDADVKYVVFYRDTDSDDIAVVFYEDKSQAADADNLFVPCKIKRGKKGLSILVQAPDELTAVFGETAKARNCTAYPVRCDSKSAYMLVMDMSSPVTGLRRRTNKKDGETE